MTDKELFTPGRFFIKDAKTGEIIKYFNTYSDAMDGYTKGVEMTDKEQIIIDGVNVSGCIFIDEWKHCNCCNTLITTIYPNATKCHEEQDLRCETYPNCTFKLLARKTQECEELKSESFTREELITLQEKDIDRYRKALDEIEEVTKDLKQDLCGNCGWYGTDGCTPSGMVCEELVKILDIIDKAKGKE